MSCPRVLVVRNAESDPVGRLGTWLTEADLDLHLVDGAELPSNLAGYAGLVVLGGPMGADDDELAPWLPHERDLLRSAVSAELPTLGICLGAQLLAAATGGRVARGLGAPEIGAQLVAKRAAAATDPLFRELPITPDVIQWHYDAIDTLPPGAVHLASSPVCENQAFRLGRLAWGVQFHIETSPEVVRRWARADASHLRDLDVDLILRRAEAVHDDILEVWRPFAHAFAAIVHRPETVAAARPILSSTAAPVTDPVAIRAALAAEADTARAGPPTATVLPMPSRRPPAAQ